MYTKTSEKDGQKTQKKIYTHKQSLQIKNISNVIAHFAFIMEETQ